MTDYERAEQEKRKLYERIRLVEGQLSCITQPQERAAQKKRLGILQAMYREALERMEAARPPQEKRQKVRRKSIVHTGAVDFDFFERCGITFADLEGNHVHWDDLRGEDNNAAKARLLRALRRGRAVVSPRQREMLSLYLSGKSASEIAQQLNVSVSTVSRTLARAKQTLNRVEDDLHHEEQRETASRLDLSSPETARYVLSHLTETQATYIYLYYGEWLDMRSIGALLGVDHSSVCRTLHRAAAKIRALCSDSGNAELHGVDALEPMLYALYQQHAADELIPERAKAAARRAYVSEYRRRQEEKLDDAALPPSIWEQEKHRTVAQSRLLRALMEASEKTHSTVFARLRALLSALRTRLCSGSAA